MTTAHIQTLIPDPDNARLHPEENLAAIRRSLERFGQVEPLVVQEDTNIVIAGNGRLEVMRELNREARAAGRDPPWSDIKVAKVAVGPLERRALAVALNRTPELAAWDEQRITELLGDIRTDPTPEFDVDELVQAMSFTEKELAAMINVSAHKRRRAEDAKQDEAPPPPAKPTTKAGDVWELGDHRLICGDATEQKLDGVDLCLTDPPYCSGGHQEAGKKAGSVGTRGNERVQSDQLSTRGYQALLKTTLASVGAWCICVFGDWRMWIPLWDAVESGGYGVKAMVVWDKATPGMGRGFRNQHELVMVASKIPQPFDPKNAQGNVIQCKRTGNKLHPTEKPVELLARMLETMDTCQHVADPFAGSGSILIACEQMERRCTAVELDAAYCDVVIERWETLTGGKARRRGA